MHLSAPSLTQRKKNTDVIISDSPARHPGTPEDSNAVARVEGDAACGRNLTSSSVWGHRHSVDLDFLGNATEDVDELTAAIKDKVENINAVLINDGMPQGERLVKLNQMAIQQMQVLEGNSNRELLK